MTGKSPHSPNTGKQQPDIIPPRSAAVEILPAFHSRIQGTIEGAFARINPHTFDMGSTDHVFSRENMRRAVQANGSIIYGKLIESLTDSSGGKSYKLITITGLIHESLGGTSGTQEFEESIQLEIIKECILPFTLELFKIHGESFSYSFPQSLKHIIISSIAECPSAIESFVHFLHELQGIHPKITHQSILDLLDTIHTRPQEDGEKTKETLKSIKSTYKNSIITDMTGEDEKTSPTIVKSNQTPYPPLANPGIILALYGAFAEKFFGSLDEKIKIHTLSIMMQNSHENCRSYDLKQDMTLDSEAHHADENQLWVFSEAILNTCRLAQEKNPAYRLSIAEHFLSNLGYEGNLSEILRSSSHKNPDDLESSLEKIEAFLSSHNIDDNDEVHTISSVVHRLLSASHAINLICLSYSHDSPYVKAVLALKGKLIHHTHRLAPQLKNKGLEREEKILNTIHCKAVLNYNWLERINAASLSDIEQQKTKIILEMKQAIEGLRKFSILTPEELAVFENIYKENRLLIMGFSIIRKIQFLSGSKKDEITSTIPESTQPENVITQSLFNDINPDDLDAILDEAFVPRNNISILKKHLNQINKLLIKNIQSSPSFLGKSTPDNVLTEAEKAIISDLGAVHTTDEYIQFFCRHFPTKQGATTGNTQLQQLIASHILPNFVNILHFSKYTPDGISPERLEQALKIIVDVERGSPWVELYVNIGTSILDNLSPAELSAENSTGLINWANALKDQLDTAGYYINEMPGIPRLYLALAQFYAGLPPTHNPEGKDEHLKKASQCVAIYIGSCGGKVPKKYEEFVNGLYEKIGKKQYQQIPLPNELRNVGTDLVRATMHEISDTSRTTAQKRIEGFFDDMKNIDTLYLDDWISLINQLCADLSVMLFSHNESIQLIKQNSQIKYHDAWHKKVLQVTCNNSAEYYLFFPYPALREDAFKKQFNDFEGELFRLRDKIKEVLSQYEKTSGLYTKAHIVQLQENKINTSDDFLYLQMNIAGIIKHSYMPEGAEQMPKLHEIVAFIKDWAKRSKLEVKIGCSSSHNTFYFMLPNHGEVIKHLDGLKNGIADNLSISVDFSDMT